MGIPSYFRRILQKYPGCLARRLEKTPEYLCFDFNCLIYRCLYSKTLREYPPDDEEDQERWENQFIEEIIKVTKEIWIEAGRVNNVYIAVDGVVPMAKVRQQRVRRFKSVWLKRNNPKKTWDTNAITPGTKFMDSLCKRLEEECKKHKGWTLSGVREPGEGEHKILSYLRSKNIQNKEMIIYGLDADLILLSLLVGEELNNKIMLMRETQEFEKQSTDGYTYLFLDKFREKLNVNGYEEIINYIGLMSLMGNDFLPHSLTHKLNDNGYDYVLKEFESMKSSKNWLVKEGKMQESIFQGITKRWSIDEEQKMYTMIQKKSDQCKRGVLDGMSEEEGLPLKWFVERDFLDEKGNLKSDWRDIYWKFIHVNMQEEEKKNLCMEYKKGFQWVLDYYTGKEIDIEWMFPSWIPPLWSALSNCKQSVNTVYEKKEWYTPEQQLVMGIPLESWDLVKDKTLRELPREYPQLWPLSYSFFSLGRKWLWECEANIPVLHIQRLREIIKS